MFTPFGASPGDASVPIVIYQYRRFRAGEVQRDPPSNGNLCTCPLPFDGGLIIWRLGIVCNQIAGRGQGLTAHPLSARVAIL